MYTSLCGMTPLTNAPKVAYDVAGLAGTLRHLDRVERRAARQAKRQVKRLNVPINRLRHPGDPRVPMTIAQVLPAPGDVRAQAPQAVPAAVSGLGDFSWAALTAARNAAPAPTRGWSPVRGSVQRKVRQFKPVSGLGDFDFGGLISGALSAVSNIGGKLIEGHYAPSSTQPLSSAPVQIIPSTQATYLPVRQSNTGTYLMVGGVAAAAVVGFLLLKRRK